ncbi:MAG: hypothetical protein A2Y14_05625 [Verrucomicrobia bacterium GWF2_51_19]|nr:MAG: hypothetical protein A2Y14_05625 [Verrucomicrobia bacterium GWF2_51_19]
MKKNHLKLLSLICLLLSGCFNFKAQRDPSQCYQLESTPLNAVSRDDGEALVLGRIDLPEYANNPKIAVLGTDSRVAFHEFQRWSEPLSAAVRRVLMENLHALRPNVPVCSYQYANAETQKNLISIQFLEFIPDQNAQKVVVRANVCLQQKTQTWQYIAFDIPCNTKDAPSVVRAFNQSLANLAQFIARL